MIVVRVVPPLRPSGKADKSEYTGKWPHLLPILLSTAPASHLVDGGRLLVQNTSQLQHNFFALVAVIAMGAEVGLHASQVGLQKCAQLDECIVASACWHLVVG